MTLTGMTAKPVARENNLNGLFSMSSENGFSNAAVVFSMLVHSPLTLSCFTEFKIREACSGRPLANSLCLSLQKTGLLFFGARFSLSKRCQPFKTYPRHQSSKPTHWRSQLIQSRQSWHHQIKSCLSWACIMFRRKVPIKCPNKLESRSTSLYGK